MEWVLIIGLAVWLYIERGRIQVLERRLNEVANQLGLLRATIRPVAPTGETAPAARARPAEPLAPTAPTAAVRTPLEAPPPARVSAARPARNFDLSNWLAENGLAWLGGGALALGGLFLVVYASQRGFFTPPMRIGAAVLAGGLMLAGSEWIRRQTRINAHPLAASAAAGAGGSTLYGAIWAAQQLYHLIPFELGAAFIVACSLGLLAYALLHGEALAVLALFGAFAAPVVTGIADWRSPAPEAFLTTIIVTGFAFSALRRWAAAGYATMAGAVLWSLAAIVEDTPLKAALLLLACAAGACLAVGWRARPDGDRAAASFASQPLIAIGVASVLAALVWVSGFTHSDPWTAVITIVVLSAIAAVALVRGLISVPVFAAPIAAAILGLVVVGADRQMLLASLVPLMLAPVLIAAIGWTASLRLSDRERLVALASASLGAACLATISRFLIESAGAQQPWMASAVTGAVMFVAAWGLVRKSGDAETDRGLALWLAGAVELVLLGIAGATPTAWEPAAHALAVAMLVGAALRLRWLGLAQAAVAASLFAFAAMLRPSFMSEALSDMPMIVLVGSTLLACAISFVCGAGLKTPERRTEADALKTASLLIGLLAAFLVIQRLLVGPASSSDLSHHLAASLRTVLLLAAALMLAMTARPDGGWLSRWRLRAVAVAGLAHGLIVQSLVLSPWWGLGEAPLGVVLFNSLIVSYLAPALLMAALYRRGMQGPSAWTRSVAVGAFLFALLWIVLTLRHAFHPGAAMDSAPLLRNESCAYVLLLLIAASALIWLRRRRTEGSDWLAIAAYPAAWTALAATALVYWLLASPWWGVQGAPLSSASVFLLFVLYGLSALAASVLQRQAAAQEGSSWTRLAQGCVVTATFNLLVMATLTVRFAFHGGEMQGRFDTTSLETWAYSAVWAIFGLGTLVAGGASRNYTLRWLGLGVLLVTVAKVLLFDTSRLDGMIRAASFLGLGVLLLAGALAARRLNARALLFAAKS